MKDLDLYSYKNLSYKQLLAFQKENQEMKMNRCFACEFKEGCPLARIINFCEDCKDYDTCWIKGVSCEAGYEIECNNGFEDDDEQVL